MNRKGEVYFNDCLCGIIEENDQGYSFQYLEEWINSKDAQPISKTLPLSKDQYFSNILFPFFDGLIPEGWLLEIAISKWKLKRNDRFGLLLTVCEDVVGAVSVKGVN